MVIVCGVTLSSVYIVAYEFFESVGYGGRSLAGGGFEVVSLDAKRFRRIGDLGGIGGTLIFVTC